MQPMTKLGASWQASTCSGLQQCTAAFCLAFDSDDTRVLYAASDLCIPARIDCALASVLGTDCWLVMIRIIEGLMCDHPRRPSGEI